ncbi:glycosyltransferase [Natronosalvus rutilus]|uniref:Glycosyltransferase n=1 Tax=Natronosalvus rutilus TaxID=2953753 RepID=A0A9E7NB10_9EURY|nr:glycosyltransferase [Natronosalvus rutilus]UTF55109.1 glycosyltransferase [Natronosalvus rutilus]
MSPGTNPKKTASGPARARNRGAKQASGDVLCFTDADTVVPPTWVRDHCRHYSVATKSTVVGVGGPLEPLEPGLRHRVCFRLLSDWWDRLSWPLGFVQQPGPNCSVRRTAFERVGGFDESLPFLEDTDLSLRLRREGEVVYDRECAVRTSVRRQEREGYGRLFLTYARGYLAYLLPGRSPSATYF